jgi:integrase
VLGPTVVEALRRRLAAADAEGHGSPFIFTDDHGRFLNRTYIRRRHFDKVCKAAAISGVHPHDLRHTMASHALAAGLSPVVVARRLGHGSTRMTMDRYGHLLPGAQGVAAAVLEDSLTGATADKKEVVIKVVNGTNDTRPALGLKNKTLAA